VINVLIQNKSSAGDEPYDILVSLIGHSNQGDEFEREAKVLGPGQKETFTLYEDMRFKIEEHVGTLPD
jgi:hypothetical protein